MESMVCSDRKSLASAVGAKSARACDNCIKRRAGWYCAADDAFLCQSCDSSVHSANPLARRHERVRLKTPSSVIKPEAADDDESRGPTWHQGFTRKARTPRHSNNKKRPAAASFFNNNCEPAVPEINNCSDENSGDEQLLYRVPVFDPFVSSRPESKPAAFPMSMSHFLPTEMDLAEFAADVESLLGNGLDNEAFDMEGLGILGDDEMRVKVEDDEGEEVINNNNNQFGDGEFIDMGRESFVLNFDYDSPVLGEEDNKNNNNNNNNNTKILLRLDYKGVMSAWDDHKSPWTTGERPDSSDCWPDCTESKVMHGYGGMMSTHTHKHTHTHTQTHASSSSAVMADGGREARVSRYREKRRTRLFSKKIRYEVRKLNAEKRPRMKGRFVKRPHFATTAS